MHNSFAASSASVIDLKGRVETQVQAAGWRPAAINDHLANGDEIQTWEGRSTLLMSDESMLKLNRNTYLQIQDIAQSASWQSNQGVISTSGQVLQSLYRLFSGNAWLRNNKKDLNVEIETPTVTASLRGTELTIEVVSAELVNITVLEGAVEARNNAGTITAFAGEMIIAPLGQAPRKQTLLSPTDSVQWTVRIPNIIDRDDWLFAQATPAEQQAMEQLFLNLQAENISAARQTIADLSTPSSNTYSTLEGLVNLSSGNHREAQSDFAKTAAQNAQNEIAFRGLALSSLLLGDKESALSAAEKALRLTEEKQAVDWLLLSAIQRAKFNLSEAESAAQKALNLEPNNILALTELGLLQFADDRVVEARATAEQAIQVDPQDSLAHSLLGYIQLSERDQQGAQLSFEKALALDPANSEAYLGMGLLAQRNGNVPSAQKALATAIALEPQRSLYLSYWAKTLHQARRFEKALTVLDSAARLDTQDPTPHYYRSIIERDLFRAGEAIGSLARAIELNDQRAVYRSRLLLDQDMATRNVDLASIYGALGMNLLATQKAIDSTMDDFRNFSAHLFLSSALTAAGRDFPAGSEVLVSGLMLPANANSLSSINDYTVFFEGPEIDSGIQLAAGNNGTFGASASLAGVAPEHDIAYGFLATTARTDGWANNNGNELDSVSATLKWQANPKDSFRARLALSEGTQLGGTFNRFEIDRRVADEVLESQDSLLDFGYRRELNHRADLLFNLVYRETEFNITANSLLASPPPDVSLLFGEITSAERNTLQLQGQYSVRTGHHQLFTGAIVLEGDAVSDFTQRTSLADQFGTPIAAPPEIQLILDEGDTLASQVGDSDRDIRFTSVYLDDIWQVSEKLTLQMGAYFEDYDDEITNESKLNPRLAAVWRPTPKDTFRIAGFRYLLPQVQSRLHPTHAGGVFITRNTEEGAFVEELNVVWERNWQSGIFSFNIFDLERENREQRDSVQAETIDHSSLRGMSLGVNQQLNNRFALSAGIEATEVRDDLTLLQTERDEINAAISLSYVSPSRFTARLSQLYRRINFVNTARETESIPITDLSLGYTFANRKGGLSLTVSNLFDEEFNWVTDAFSVDGRNPAREIVGSVSWNF